MAAVSSLHNKKKTKKKQQKKKKSMFRSNVFLDNLQDIYIERIFGYHRLWKGENNNLFRSFIYMYTVYEAHLWQVPLVELRSRVWRLFDTDPGVTAQISVGVCYWSLRNMTNFL